MPGARGWLAGQVGAQARGAPQVHVAQVGPGQRGIHVREQPQHPRHRARHRDLRRAHQRHVDQPEQPRGVGGELRGEVGRGREEDRDDVVGREPVALQHGLDQLRGPLQHVVAGVGVHLDRPADRPHRHLQAHRAVERPHLGVGQPAEPARPLVAQLHLADRRAHQLLDGMADLGEQPPHDVLAALVDDELDERPRPVRVDDPEAVDHDRPVLQLDALVQPPPEVARDGAEHLGQVGLLDLVGGMGQAVAQLPVVGQQQQALGVGVEPPDVEQPRAGAPVEVLVHRAALDEQVADRPAPLLVRHGRHQSARTRQPPEPSTVPSGTSNTGEPPVTGFGGVNVSDYV